MQKIVPNPSLRSIGVARELESPENPGAMDKRVVLAPDAVATLCKRGCSVAIEQDAGLGVGYSNADYEAAGARIESHEDLYAGKDLVIKLKAMAMEDIPRMTAGTTLFCMAHNRSFPERARLLEQHEIVVVAMENVLQSPKVIPDAIIVGKVGMREALRQWEPAVADLDITFIDYSERTVGAIRRAGNRNPKSLGLVRSDIDFSELVVGPTAAYVFDGEGNPRAEALGAKLASEGCLVFDLARYAAENAPACVVRYHERHPPYEFGGRRIECLHETGAAGAAFGLKLLREESPLALEPKMASPAVLGYGNVGMGAIHELHKAGVPRVEILTRHTTKSPTVESHLRRSQLVVNGAEQAVELRGKHFLVTQEHVRDVLCKGSVVVDLVGGSPSNRSAVENVVQCSFLTDPFFIEHGVYISALWGWPMMGMMKESSAKYSGQVLEILTEPGGMLGMGV